VIHGVVLGSPLPRGAYLDVAGHDAQVRSLLVLGEFGRRKRALILSESVLMVPVYEPSSARVKVPI